MKTHSGTKSKIQSQAEEDHAEIPAPTHQSWESKVSSLGAYARLSTFEDTLEFQDVFTGTSRFQIPSKLVRASFPQIHQTNSLS